MNLRRVAAVGVVCLMALLAPALVRAAGAAPSAIAFVPRASGGSLVLKPAAGVRRAAFAASYTYGQSCPPGAQAALIWDGRPIAVVSRPQKSAGQCSAGFSNQVPPQGLSQPGDHVVQAALVTCSDPQSCAPVGGSDASQTYTIYPADAAPPTEPQPPAPPPPTATPTPSPTPVPTPLGISDVPGTFAPHDCRNGIPDATPCPTPVSGIAGLVTGPTASAPPPATTPPPAGDSRGMEVRTMGLVAGGIAVLVAAAVALAIRQGGTGSTGTRSSSRGRGRRASAAHPELDVTVATFGTTSGEPPRRGPAPPTRRTGGIPPPPSAPGPPLDSY